jgi:Tol biopolymer transport system component
VTHPHRVALPLAFLVLTAAHAQTQLPRDPEQRAKIIAQTIQTNAAQLTLFDRNGEALGPIGSRDLQDQPVFSPDGARLAVVRRDLDRETNDIWVIDITTGKTTRITVSQTGERVREPVWSPDGSRIAYVAARQNARGIYQKPSDGTGDEQLLLKTEWAPDLGDWSIDGKYLSYARTDLSGGTLYALPLTGERKPIPIFQSKSQLGVPRLSPDDRFVSYTSNETGRDELYVRPFTADANTQWKISDGGGRNGTWRRDGHELYYIAADRGIMAVSITASPDFAFGTPALLFRPALDVGNAPTAFTRDGDRIVIAVPPPALRQLTILDRAGRVVAKVGPPGIYGQPNFSPDGRNIAVMRTDPQKGKFDIWNYEVATGKGIAVTNDNFQTDSPIWSSDGKQIAYVSTRQGYAGIYRKAADGSGEEEQLFRYTPGASITFTDWSRDGKFLTFYTGVLSLVPLDPNVTPLDRKALDWLREDYDVALGRFSPDGRYLAFLSNEGETDASTFQVYVRPFDASKPATYPPGKAIKISNDKDGAQVMIVWRQDGNELIYLTRDGEVMSVDITTTPTFHAGTPKVLFRMDGPFPGYYARGKNVTGDGQRFVFAMPVR